MHTTPFQGFLFFIFIIGGLIGIYVFATHRSTPPGPAIGTVAVWGTLPRDQIQSALQSAIQTNEGLKSVTYTEKNPATFDNDLVSAIAVGNPPDLVLINQEHLIPLLKVVSTIPASELPQSSFEKAFADGANVFWAPDGSGAYGVPFLIDPLVTFVNRPLLSSNSIAQVPQTWEAITALVPQVTTLSPSGGITRAFAALGTYSNVRDARALLSALFLQSGVSMSTVSNTGFRSADLGTRSGSSQNGPPGQGVLRFYTQFADPTKSSYTWNAALPDSQSDFVTGDAALYFGFGSEAQYFTKANPNLDFALAPLPQPGNATSKATYGLFYAFVVPRGSANPNGAFQAAALLTNPDINRTFSNSTGLAPAVRSVLASPPSDAMIATTYTSALYAKGWLSPAPSDVDRVFSAMINNVTSGRFDVQSALSSAESNLSALLQ